VSMKVFVHAGKLNKAEISGQANLVTTRSRSSPCAQDVYTCAKVKFVALPI